MENTRSTTPSPETIEGYSGIAYTLAHLAPEDCADVGELLETLVGRCRLRFVDMGVAHGDAEMSFTPDGEPGYPICTDVRFLVGQRRPMVSLAGARACAKFVAWKLRATWCERMLSEVTLAIAMPEGPFREDMADMGINELAEAYNVEPGQVFRRLRMLRDLDVVRERRAEARAST